MGYSIGRCSFHGTKPSSATSIGSMTVYHNGTLRSTMTRGTVTVYEVNGGDVWVIYGSWDQVDRYEFRGGHIQTCTANI